jgi:hypothetical protein
MKLLRQALFPIILFPFLLAGCGGVSITSSSLPCHPPAEVMAKADPLTAIPASSMTMNEIIQGWVQDNQKYSVLRNKDNVLVDWVNDHCQK